MKEKKSELAIIDFAKFDIQQLPELQGKKEEIKSIITSNPIVDVVDNSTYELAKKSRTAVKTFRTGLEKEQKDVKKKIKEYVLDVVDGEYDMLILGVKNQEIIRQEPITIWEEKKEQERLERLRLEQERIDGIKSTISLFKQGWEVKISELTFENCQNLKENLVITDSEFDRVSLNEFEILFDDTVLYLTNLLNSKINTLTEQEQIRIDNLQIQEKNAEIKRIQEWQRTWDANIDTLSFGDIKDVKIIFVKSKITNLKHYSDDYEQIYVSTEKRLHSQIELISKAEEQRIAQEKFLADKKVFEDKQSESKRISDEAIRLDVEKNKLINIEVEFEEVDNLIAEKKENEPISKGLSTRLKANTPAVKKELTWDDIMNEYTENCLIGEPVFLSFLKDNFNVPTRKI